MYDSSAIERECVCTCTHAAHGIYAQYIHACMLVYKPRL